MDLEKFFRQSRILAVVGKGGVGRTTVTSALASVASTLGLDVLIVSLDHQPRLGSLFGWSGSIGYDEVDLVSKGEDAFGVARANGRVKARVISAEQALVEYLAAHGLGRVAGRLSRLGAVDIVATAIPGIREVLVLGKLKQLERESTADIIVFDAPASGHAVSFLKSPTGLSQVARAGPLRTQSDDVVELLSDATRCRVLLVTLPEETPVNETIETAYRIEDELGVALGPVVINACYPALFPTDLEPQRDEGAPDAVHAAAHFRQYRERLQRAEIERLARELPLEQIELPFLFRAELGPPELAVLGAELKRAIEAMR